MSLKIASASVADLYTVPASAWAAIHQRVKMAQIAQPMASEIQTMLPHFPDLVTACQQWQSSTFPAIVAQSRLLAAYAAQALQDFTPLAATVAALDPGAPLDPAVHSQAQAALLGLSQRTSVLSKAFDDLKPQINNFYIVNGQVDTEAARYAGQLGFLGESITKVTQAVDDATGQVLGEWGAIADDLDTLTAQQVDLTVDVLLSLELQTALLVWQGIGEEVAGFQRNLVDQAAVATA
ncbi:hypothetical protein [Hymenobacter jeollabukensis]|uniref:Uncharacterized protein n=1 Tax=Hymenobacter jeollabukensis TaxID=2025313 RepID=A0A5R8WS16_9BACT|nr:hypothetical protein [Hymenobacter jeollabukensis]TLM93922.1 hypothetical protein FDY95_07770 [Hymenobacter jeollabukensis]